MFFNLHLNSYNSARSLLLLLDFNTDLDHKHNTSYSVFSYLIGSDWTKGWQRRTRHPRLWIEGKVKNTDVFLKLSPKCDCLFVCLFVCSFKCWFCHSSPLRHLCDWVCCCCCLQGEKGEPGLVIGPDGNPLYLDGLIGLKVSLSAFECLLPFSNSQIHTPKKKQKHIHAPLLCMLYIPKI